MYLQYFFSATHIRSPHRYLTVETTGTQDRGIENIHTVRSCHDDNAFVDTETVHLYQ